jgi:tagatose 6-phosphate kinase
MINVVGLTPAWQQILTFDKLQQGEVNRAARVHWCASGKVINVGLALTRLGGQQAVTITVLGGHARPVMEQQLQAAGVSLVVVPTQTATRVCTTLLDQATSTTTELVENAAAISAQETITFLDRFRQQAANATTLVVTGSLTAGLPAEFYREFCEPLVNNTIWDIQGPGLLAILPSQPTLIKPNRYELGRTLQRELTTDEAVWQAMRELQQRGAQHVLVSDGAVPGFLLSRDGRRWRFHAPRLEQVVNPIGSGDCLTAGIAAELDAGSSLAEAVRQGVAAAAANVEHLLPAAWEPARLAELRDLVQIQPV